MSAVMTGQKHWQAPDNLRFFKKDPAFAYRAIVKADVPRRLDEGWEIAVDERLTPKQGEAPTDRALHYRGLIIMRIPREMKDERNAYYLNLHKQRLRAVARGAHMSAVAKARTSDGESLTEDGKPLAGTIGAGLRVHQGVQTNDGLKHTDDLNIPLSAHPDDLREDLKVAEDMQKDKTAPPEEKEGKPAKAIPAKSGQRKRR